MKGEPEIRGARLAEYVAMATGGHCNLAEWTLFPSMGEVWKELRVKGLQDVGMFFGVQDLRWLWWWERRKTAYQKSLSCS